MLSSSSSSTKSCMRSPGVMYGLSRRTACEEAGAKSASSLGRRLLLYQLQRNELISHLAHSNTVLSSCHVLCSSSRAPRSSAVNPSSIPLSQLLDCFDRILPGQLPFQPSSVMFSLLFLYRPHQRGQQSTLLVQDRIVPDTRVYLTVGRTGLRVLVMVRREYSCERLVRRCAGCHAFR